MVAGVRGRGSRRGLYDVAGYAMEGRTMNTAGFWLRMMGLTMAIAAIYMAAHVVATPGPQFLEMAGSGALFALGLSTFVEGYINGRR